MKKTVLSWFRFVILLVAICFATHSATAETPKAEKPKAKQFIYVLRLVPRLHSDSAWTDQDKAALAQHFNRFKESADRGELILAGRTQEPGDKTFGIAIFEAPDEKAAKKYMEGDPAVVSGVMTAELHPFAVALQRKNP